jgi:fluoride ion exporter CrcB/FEX
MFRQLQNNTVPITIGVSFYLFGFFVMANALDLTDREIVIGLIAGAIGGLTTLVTALWPERKAAHSASATPASV